MSVSDVSFTIEFKGKTVPIKRPDFGVEQAFERYVQNRALLTVEMLTDANTRAEAVGRVIGEIVAGKYSYEYDPIVNSTNYVNDFLRTPAGRKEWCYTILTRHAPWLSSKDGRESWFEPLWKDKDKRDELMLKIAGFNLPSPSTAPLTEEPGSGAPQAEATGK